jgi:hypothetical protein
LGGLCNPAFQVRKNLVHFWFLLVLRPGHDMSSAFVKEGEARHLKDVAPNLGALLFFLRIENNGTVIRDEKNYLSQRHGREVYEMSDGLTYALNDAGQWFIILD